MTPQRVRVEKGWRNLAKSVLDLAFYDLSPSGEDHHVNSEKERKTAIAWFESGKYRVWAEAAGFSKSDCEQAYLDLVDKPVKV